jgi:hypothetical protein
MDPPLRAKRLVVSMSSFPGRVEYVNPTIFSIMNGLRKPDKLYLWVPLNVSRFGSGDAEVNGLKELPDNVKGLPGHFQGAVQVKVPPKDYGPATKLLPTLLEEKDPDTVIITIDVSVTMCFFACLWHTSDIGDAASDTSDTSANRMLTLHAHSVLAQQLSSTTTWPAAQTTPNLLLTRYH